MPTTPPTLEQLQRWMQAVITHPAGVEAGLESSDARQQINASAEQLESIILPSSTQSSLERLAVYGNAYYLRLLDCLREFFPCLVDALGRDTFDEFAIGYLQRYPSTSYTLHRLADQFVKFLQETQPTSDASWAGFVVDLARLELAIEQVFDAPGPEGDPWPDSQSAAAGREIKPLVDLSAADLSSASRLAVTPGMTLLAFDWPVSRYYTAWKRDSSSSWPEPEPQYVALLRRNYVVRRHELTCPMFELLAFLVEGLSVGEAIDRLSGGEQGAAVSAQEVRQWFFSWAREGFFAGAERN